MPQSGTIGYVLYVVEPCETGALMPVKIQGETYYSSADVSHEIGVSRQTFWRWRQDGKVPLGRKYRDRQLLFTAAEFDRVREYAHRLEPVAPTSAKQYVLFKRQEGLDEQR